LTVLAAVGAVLVVRVTAVTVLDPPKMFQPLGWFFPIFDTVVLVTAAVVVFAVVTWTARTPIRTYRRIALVALALSMIPDLIGVRRAPAAFTWPRASALMLMHVAAWWVTVTLLSKLTAQRLR
jgi:hypothetical protein